MKKRVRARRTIPLCSMADIAFILLIFFIVTTTLYEQGLKVELPKAMEIEKIGAKKIEDIFINSKGEVMIDGEFINNIEDIRHIFSKKKNERFIVALNVDKDCPYGVVSRVLDELKLAHVIYVSFIVEKEKQ